MKIIKKLVAIVLCLALATTLFAPSPAEAKKKTLLGVPVHVSGEGAVELLVNGNYEKDGIELDEDADFYLSYVLYVPKVGFDKWWNESNLESKGGWIPDDDPIGSISITPYIHLWSRSKQDQSLKLFTNNQWTVNHSLKSGNEFDISRWTEEFGVQVVDDVEGKGVMTAEIVDDMVKITVKDLPATTHEWMVAKDGTAWGEEKPNEDGFIGDEDMLFCLRIEQWTGKTDVETCYITDASIRMGKEVIWKDRIESNGNAGLENGDITDGETVSRDAVAFNTSYLTVAKDSIKIAKKKTARVKVTTMTADDKVEVSSSNKKIATATLKKGKVKIKGKKAGSAVITVKANGVSKEIKVIVK